MVSFSAKATENGGILDDWGQSALDKEFSWCRVNVHGLEWSPGEYHIVSIMLEHKSNESGNAYFHGGECDEIMLSIARGPGSRVNFKKVVTTGKTWVDNVTGNRLKENDTGYEVQGESGSLVGELRNRGQDFVITDVKFASDAPDPEAN